MTKILEPAPLPKVVEKGSRSRRVGALQAVLVAWRARNPLVAFVAIRLLTAVGLLFAVSILIFLGTSVLPGDAASVILGRKATPETLAALRAELGLNKPLLDQYLTWVGGAVHGNLGISAGSRLPVSELIVKPVTNTLILASVAAALLAIIGVGLGTLAGLRQQRAVDHVVSWSAMIALSVPDFVAASVLALVLAVQLRWLQATSILPPGQNALSQPQVLVLPVLTILIVGSPYVLRMVRAGVIDTAKSEFVMMARLNGISERRVIGRYILRNSLPATIQVFAQMVQWLVGGVFIVETVFAYPGIGLALVNAVQVRDMPYVQAVALVIATLYILLNLLADLLVVLAVPKMRNNPQ